MSQGADCIDDPWEPDPGLVIAAAAGSLLMSNLCAEDRSWVVAGLTHRGLTAEVVADRLGCSLRLIRTVRADPMTRVCSRMIELSVSSERELRLAQVEVRSATSSEAAVRAELCDMRAQRDRLLDEVICGEPVRMCGKGHAMTTYNTYHRHGRRYCRECHRERQAKYRRQKGREPVEV